MIQIHNKYGNLMTFIILLLTLAISSANMYLDLFYFNITEFWIYIYVVTSIIQVVQLLNSIGKKYILYCIFFPIPMFVKIDYAKKNIKKVYVKNNYLIVKIKYLPAIKIGLNPKFYVNSDIFAQELFRVLEIDYKSILDEIMYIRDKYKTTY